MRVRTTLAGITLALMACTSSIAGVVYRGNPHVFTEPMTHVAPSTGTPGVPGSLSVASPSASELTRTEASWAIDLAVTGGTGPYSIVSTEARAGLSVVVASDKVRISGSGLANASYAMAIKVKDAAGATFSVPAFAVVQSTPAAAHHPHRFWGLMNVSTQGGATGIAEFELLFNGSKVPATGATAFANTTWISDVPSRAIDGDASTFWSSNGGGTSDALKIDLGRGKTATVDQIRITARTDAPFQAPRSYDIVYSDDAFATYKVARHVDDASAYAAGESRTFDLAGDDTASVSQTLFQPHRHWSIRNMVARSGGCVSMSEVYFNEFAGGVPTAQPVPATSASGSYDSGSGPANLVDRNEGTIWHSTCQSYPWVSFDFGSPFSFAQLRIAPRQGIDSQAPGFYDFAYSDDGSSWTVLTAGATTLELLPPAPVPLSVASPTSGNLSQAKSSWTFDLAIKGGTGPYTLVSSEARQGLSVAIAGGSVRVSGAAAPAGSYPMSIRVKDAAGEEFAVPSFTLVQAQAPVYNPHRFWALLNIRDNGNAASMAEFELLAGGSPVALSSAGLIVDSNYSTNESARKAVDGDPNTAWSSVRSSGAHHFMLDLGAGKAAAVDQVRIKARSGGNEGQTPTVYDLAFSDDGGGTWTTAVHVDSPSYGPAEQRTIDLPGETGPAGAPYAVDVTPHRYWSLRNIVPQSGSCSSFAEVRFSETPAGFPNAVAAPLASSSSVYASNYGPAYLLDDDDNTIWHSACTPPEWVAFDFGSPYAFKSLTITPRSGIPSQGPGSYDVSYSDDGTTWTPKLTGVTSPKAVLPPN